jgi:hypothetical protein
MTIIVENGTIVTDANSYVSDAEYVAYASQRSYSIGTDADTRENELIKAMDYLEQYRFRFKGLKVSGGQSLQWPRYGVYLDSFQLDSNLIPRELKRSQMELAILSIASDLAPSGNLENVQSQSLGELSISYYSGGTYKSLQHDNVDQYLDCLLINNGNVMSVRV